LNDWLSTTTAPYARPPALATNNAETKSRLILVRMSASLWVKMPAHHTPMVELSVDGIDTTRQQHAALSCNAAPICDRASPVTTREKTTRARQK
jgi:hypothetical protein